MSGKDKKFICQSDVEACEAKRKSVEKNYTKRHAEVVEKIKVLW